MADVDARGGGILVENPHTSHFFTLHQIPKPTTEKEADLYSKLKKLERELEFLTLQEVLFLVDLS